MRNYIIVAIIIILIIIGVVWYKASNPSVPTGEETATTTEVTPSTDTGVIPAPVESSTTPTTPAPAAE